MVTLTNPKYRTISDHNFAVVQQNLTTHQKALFAQQSFQPGEMIAEFFAGTIGAEPTYLTVQVDVGKHITLQPEFLQYINHSCAPNVFFDTSAMQLVALREIQEGEEMTFFYPSTEWEMIQPFNCYCGSVNCLGRIQGAAYLRKNVRKQYRLTDFIQQQLAKRSARQVRA
jgi:SET domain